MDSALTQRDYAILRHVARYRLTTREALHRALFPHVAINAVTKVTSALLDRGLAAPVPGVLQVVLFHSDGACHGTAGDAAISHYEPPSPRKLRPPFFRTRPWCCKGRGRARVEVGG